MKVHEMIDGESESMASAWIPLFGALSKRARAGIAKRAELVSVRGGSRLMTEGEEGDSAFILLSGRLRATVSDGQGRDRFIGEVSRGESVGEIALMTGEPRTATIHAIRDSTLARLSRDAFEALIRDHPELLLNLSRLVVRRFRRSASKRAVPARVRNIAVIFHDTAASRSGFMERIARTMQCHGRTLCLDSGDVKEKAARSSLEEWLNRQEQEHRFVLYRADRKPSAWTRLCLRQADRVLLVATFDQDSDPGEVESAVLCREEPTVMAESELVLLHPDGDRPPEHTRRWLEGRKVLRHHHVRLDRDGDLSRLGRFLAGEAVGIVLAGGGAKGFAHVGVIEALREKGFPLDVAGGTSIGAITAAAVALDWDHDILVSNHREAFTRRNPLNDYNLLPMVSLYRGAKMEALLRRYLGEADIEDMWLPFFCVSSNMSRYRRTVHNRGKLWKAVRASLSLPGVLPPVVYGNDLHVDGGSFDNLPVDTCRGFGPGRIIASNIGVDVNYKLNYETVPTAWQLFVDRYVTRKRRLKVPGLVNTVFRATVLSSFDRSKELGAEADLYLESPVQRIGLMEWGAFDRARDTGYRHTLHRLLEENLVPDGWTGSTGRSAGRQEAVRT